ncbi:MAG: hypothetical protein DRJ32_06395 [Thermoprotei archaeon]|nr:MAG: hypothetical protein DRJ32_06395 [Thermoprotei archaeon]HDD64136.1 sulfite exporter TauE/SafE family protein [Thermoprotei archaeon]
MDPMLIACFIIGVLAGCMSGIFGIGGGSVRTPLLILVGIPPLSAFAINLIVIPFSSIVGAISHRRNVDAKTGLYVVIGGCLGSMTGALLVGLVSKVVLAILFLASSLITIFGMYLYKIAPRTYERINPTPQLIVAGAFILNLITGMRGGSGGSLFPPFLRMMKLDIRRAIATSLFSTIFTATMAILIYWYRGNVIWLPAISTTIGSMLGARIGSRISLKAKPKWLEICLTILVLSLSLIAVYKMTMYKH